MKTWKSQLKSVASALALSLAGLSAAQAGTVRVLWYSDGGEGAVIADLLKRFEAKNPDIKVVLDNVSFDVVREQLPVQLEAGRGPDIARVTVLKGLSQHWLDLRPHLKDPAAFEKNLGAELDWMRPDGSNAITGFMTQVTLTGGFANKTLFDQAGVALPGPKASWDEWAAAAKKVATSQKTPLVMAMDRSGQRITGPALSMGAKYIAADGKPAILDEGFKAMASRFAEWNKSGVMTKEVWVSAAGSTYRAAAEDFINGQLVYYYSGSWQVPNFAAKIKNNFDWVATGSPCGPAACTGMPGGAGLVAIKYTQNPKDVAAVMEYLSQEEVVKEFSERSLFLPAHKGVLAKGLDFKTSDPQVKAALNAFVAASASISPIAAKLPAWRWSDPAYAAIVSRVSQVVAGELTLDAAYARIEEDIAKKVAEATRQ